jgi:hypothetical protein
MMSSGGQFFMSPDIRVSDEEEEPPYKPNPVVLSLGSTAFDCRLIGGEAALATGRAYVAEWMRYRPSELLDWVKHWRWFSIQVNLSGWLTQRVVNAKLGISAQRTGGPVYQWQVRSQASSRFHSLVAVEIVRSSATLVPENKSTAGNSANSTINYPVYSENHNIYRTHGPS